MIDAAGVIHLRLAMEAAAKPAKKQRKLEGVLGHELAGQGKHFLRGEGAGKEAHALRSGRRRGISVAAEDEHRNLGQSGMELGNKGGSGHAGHVRPSDDEAEMAGKLRLLKHAERLGRIGYPQHILESFLQNGFAHGRLKRVIVHQ